MDERTIKQRLAKKRECDHPNCPYNENSRDALEKIFFLL